MSAGNQDKQEAEATIRLLAELAKGVESLRQESGLTLEEAFAGLEDDTYCTRIK